MRILHVVHGYPPSIGGSQLVMKNLSEHFTSIYGDRVTVFTTTAYNMSLFWQSGEPAMPAGTQTVNGVVVHRFPVFSHFGRLRMLLAHGAHRLGLPYNDWLRTIYNGPIIFGMKRAVAEADADVVAATAFPHLHMYDALAGARRGGIPIVFFGAVHVGDPWGFERKMMFQAIREADAYIAYTPFERDYLVERGIRPEKITIVGPGVDPDPFMEADGEMKRQQYGWGDRPVVAMVAKQGPHKRFDTMLEAMPAVWARFPKTQLLIAGAQTTYSSQIRRMIDSLPTHWRDRVTVIDDFPEKDKAVLLAACDLFALPSGHESFGIVYLEAWACGKPVIGARVGAVPSLIDEGQDGLLVTHRDADDLARAILKLLGDQDQRMTMGEAGRRKVLRNYTWEIVSSRVREVYIRVTKADD